MHKLALDGLQRFRVGHLNQAASRCRVSVHVRIPILRCRGCGVGGFSKAPSKQSSRWCGKCGWLRRGRVTLRTTILWHIKQPRGHQNSRSKHRPARAPAAVALQGTHHCAGKGEVRRGLDGRGCTLLCRVLGGGDG